MVCKHKADENTPGCFTADQEGWIRQGLREIKKTCRWCMVVSHAGHEFGHMPLPYPRNRYLEYGADVVVGYYPRVVQNYETVGEKIIFYSLGKFIFDTDYQRAQRHTEYGMLVRLSFGEGSFTWGHLPTRIHRESRTIDAGPCPAIFRDIQPGQYRLLWPLAAWDLCRNERVKYAFNKPELRGYSRWDWLLKWEIGRCKTDQGRDTMRSRIRSLLQLWRLADREVVAYIRGR